MKKIHVLLILLASMFIANTAFATGDYRLINYLPTASSVVSTDEMEVVVNPSTSPELKKVTIANINASLRSATNVGTANTGVTAVEYGDGYNHTTVLTVAAVNSLTVTDNSAICDGYLLYTFPAGEIIVNSVSMTMAGTLAEDTTATPEMCIGTVIGSDTQATCGADDAGLEDMLGPATADDMAGTAEVLAVAVASGTPLVIATAGAHLVHFNVCATWADTAGTDLTGDLAGNITLNWQFMQ